MNKRIEDYTKTLPILELYRCIQSEGSRFGRPTIAVRTTGCTHRCYFGEGGCVIHGTQVFILRKEHLHFRTLLTFMMKTHTLKK